MILGEVVVGDGVDKVGDAACHDGAVMKIHEERVEQFFSPAAGAWSGTITMTLDIVENFLDCEWRFDSHLLLIQFPSRRWSTSTSRRIAMVGVGRSRGMETLHLIEDANHVRISRLVPLWGEEGWKRIHISNSTQ